MESNKFSGKARVCLAACLGLAQWAAALTNGPSMPEYSKFEPIEATDLVHLASGNFQYTLPILTVPGPELSYAVTLNYHSGIRPGQEASWVGLGWNLQPGAITRQVNKVPDDYRGISIYDYLKSGTIASGNSMDINFMGATLGVSSDSYNGMGGMVGYSMALTDNFGVGARAGWNGVYEGYGLTFSSGMYSGGVSYANGTVGLDVGLDYAVEADGKDGPKMSILNLGSLGVSLDSKGIAGTRVGFMGVQQAGAGISTVKVDERKNGALFGVGRLNYRKFTSWIEGYNFSDYFGFIYSDVDGLGCRSNTNNCTNNSPGSNNGYNLKVQEFQESTDPFSGPVDVSQARVHATTQDNYQVNAQGLFGMFKPYRREDGDYVNVLKGTSKFTWDWFSSGRDYLNRTASLESGRNGLYMDNANGKKDLYWRFLGDEAAVNRSEIGATRRDIGEAYAPASKIITPLFDIDPVTGNPTTIKGFSITKDDGTTYEFKKPVYVLSERTSTLFKNEVMSNEVDFSGAQSRMGKFAYAWLLTAIKAPDYLNLGNQDDIRSGYGAWVAFTYEDLPTPYNWVTPYVDRTVHTDYVSTRDFAPDPLAQTAQVDGINYQTGRAKQEGRKNIAYLKTIETPTHTAEFVTSNRLDGIGSAKPMVHHFDRASTACSNCLKSPTIAYKYQLIIPKEWSGIREGDVLKNQLTAMIIRAVYYEMTSPYDWVVKKCDKTGWDQTLWFGGKRVVDWGDLCAEVPPSWQYSGYNPYIGSIDEFKFTYPETSPTRLKALDKIILRAGSTVVSTVNFNYDYSLSPGTPNSTAANKGKLTLTGVMVGAGTSGPYLPPYVFDYQNKSQYFQTGGLQSTYEKFQTDRWGFASPTATDANHPVDPSAVTAWNLNKITLPSGGSIAVEYEPNRIRYVTSEEYFRPGADGYRRVYWHQDAQYAPSKMIYGNPLNGPTPYVIRGLEFEFREMDDPTWKNLVPEIQYKNTSGSTVTMTMTKRTDAPQNRLVWVWPTAGSIRAQDLVRFRLLNAKDKKWMRVSLLVDPPADPTIPGAGVRVKSITSTEPITLKSNKVLYTYYDGVVDALPNSISDYNDSWVESGLGRELYQGTGTDLIYSKVRAEPEGAFGYTEFQFLTPREFGVFLSSDGKIGTDAGGKDLYRITVKDYSSMWGQLWKVQEFSETDATKPVRESGSVFAFPSGSVNTLEYLQDGFPMANGKIDVFNSQGLGVDNASDHFDFGRQQTVSSARYFYKGCYVSNGCESTPPISTTQVVSLNYVPHLLESWSSQDGVKTVTQNYRFDLMTGRPLNSRVENTVADGRSEWHVKAEIPAYSRYPRMLARNQLSQTAISVDYHYPAGSSGPPTFIGDQGRKLPISGDPDGNAVAAEITRWRPYDQYGKFFAVNNGYVGGGIDYSWRKFETLKWLNRRTPTDEIAFQDPNDACSDVQGQFGTYIQCDDAYYGNWASQGQVRTYHQVSGDPEEVMNPDGDYESRIVSFLDGKTSAEVQNARRSQAVYQSFEYYDWVEDTPDMGGYTLRRDTKDAKTGKYSNVTWNAGPSGLNKVCFYGPDAESGRGLTASVWFYDSDPALRPGISIGASGACYAESFPSGVATGSRTWKRLEAGIASGFCGDVHTQVCLYASRGQTGPHVRYDEMRAHPTDAFMTTYTYDEKGNINSMADARETVTWFDYDAFGELMGIRNDDGLLISGQSKQMGGR